MKRILIFSLQYYPLVGGAEVAIKEITDRLSPEEYEFHMVTLRYDASSSREEHIGNVHVHRVGRGMKDFSIGKSFSLGFYFSKVFFIPFAARKGLSLHRRLQFSGAWAMMCYMLFPLVLMRMVGVRIPYLLTLQEGDPFEHVFERPHIKLVAPLLLYGIRHAAVVQVISNFLGTWVRKCGYRGQVEVVPNGVDLSLFLQKFSEEEKDVESRALGVPADTTLLGTTSRLVHKNAIDTVIRALPLAPNTTFVIYGIGPEEAKLKALAEELQVSDRVFFKGQAAYKDLPRLLSACDIFIRPSRSEGMGNSFIEAMAAGLPVIATQEGGIADFLFDAVRNPDKEPTGWAVDVDAPDQIATAIKNITENPVATAAVTARARTMVQEGYGWDSIAEQMLGCFNTLSV